MYVPSLFPWLIRNPSPFSTLSLLLLLLFYPDQHQLDFIVGGGEEGLFLFCCYSKVAGASLVAQLIKNLPAIQETLVSFLGQEDPLEKG